MSGQGRHCSIEARIRNPGHTDIAVIVRIPDKPLHRIICVGRLICLPSGLAWVERTDVLILALTHIAAPYILQDNDVPVLGEQAHILPQH